MTVEISNSKRIRVVHTNRLQHRIRATADSSESTLTKNTTNAWSPPQIEHFVEETDTPTCRNPPATDMHPNITDLKLVDKLLERGANVD